MHEKSKHRADLLASSSRRLASISLLGGYFGRLEGSQAKGLVLKNCKMETDKHEAIFGRMFVSITSKEEVLVHISLMNAERMAKNSLHYLMQPLQFDGQLDQLQEESQ